MAVGFSCMLFNALSNGIIHFRIGVFWKLCSHCNYQRTENNIIISNDITNIFVALLTSRHNRVMLIMPRRKHSHCSKSITVVGNKIPCSTIIWLPLATFLLSLWEESWWNGRGCKMVAIKCHRFNFINSFN